MADRLAWTSGTPSYRVPLEPELIRLITKMWALHSGGSSWAEVGESIGMSRADVEITFNGVLRRGLTVDPAKVSPVCDAYWAHYEGCDDCDGPQPGLHMVPRAS